MINFEEVRDILEGVREKYFTSKGLDTQPGIFYMNGNDGTDFDFTANGRVCEFYIFKKTDDVLFDFDGNCRPATGDGLAKLLLFAGGRYTVYVYDYDDPFGGKFEEINGETNIDVYELACHLQAEFDDQNIWDEEVTSWVLEKSTPISCGDDEDDWDDDYYDYDDDDYDDED